LFQVSGLNRIFFVIAKISVLVPPFQLFLPSIKTHNYQNNVLSGFMAISSAILFSKFEYCNHQNTFMLFNCDRTFILARIFF
jgi:hypothetical protein